MPNLSVALPGASLELSVAFHSRVALLVAVTARFAALSPRRAAEALSRWTLLGRQIVAWTDYATRLQADWNFHFARYLLAILARGEAILAISARSLEDFEASARDYVFARGAFETGRARTLANERRRRQHQ